LHFLGATQVASDTTQETILCGLGRRTRNGSARRGVRLLVRGFEVGDHFLRIQPKTTCIRFSEALEVELPGETVEAFFLEIIEVRNANAGFVRDTPESDVLGFL